MSNDAKLKEVLDDPLRAAMRYTGMTEDEVRAEWARIEREETTRTLRLDRSAEFLPRKRMEAAGAPERHIRHVCDQAPQECDAMRAVRLFLDSEQQDLLVISGGTGTRKSGSACWMLSQVDGGMYAKSPNLLGMAIEDKQKYYRLTQAKYVVFDDLKTEKQDEKGEWVKTFNSLFDDWYGNCAKVILTGNFGVFAEDGSCITSPVDEFEKLYGARVRDRLREAGRFMTIGGASMRRRTG